MRVRLIASYRPAADRAGGFLPLRLASGMDHQGTTVWIFELYYRRLWLSLVTLTVLGYFAASAALYYWLAQQPHNQVGWLDLAAPWRWSRLNAKRGDAAVLTALDDLKERNYASAFYNLRVGLARAPGQAQGRLTMARMLLGHDPARAVAVMEEGIPACVRDDKFVAGLLEIYASQQIQAHALAIIDSLLQTAPTELTPAGRLNLTRGRFDLLLQLGRYADAEAALPEARARDMETAARQECELRIKMQQWPEARQIFDSGLTERLADPSVARLAMELAVGTGDADLLQRVVRRLKGQAPDAPAPYLLAFQAWHRMNRLSFRDATEQEYYQLFARNEVALQSLAALAVNWDIPEVVSRARGVAADSHFSVFAFQVHQTELALRRQQVDQAMQLLPAWEKGIETLKKSQHFYPEFIKRLTRATFTGADDQRAALISHLAANRGLARLPVYLLAGSVLAAADEPAGAAEVLRLAQSLYPQSDSLLAQRQLIEVRLTTRPQADSVALTEVRPALVLPATVEEAQTQIGALLEQNEFVAARDWLRAIRAEAPVWLSSIESAIACREVELAYLTLDPLASRSAARGYLKRYRAESETLALIAVVGRLLTRERLAEARLLHDEIVAESASTVRVQLALHELALPDDLADNTATQASATVALDRWILAQNWVEAERLLKYLHEKPPAWVATGTNELKMREVPIRLGLDQRPLALAALKELVIKGGVARGAAFKLVRNFLAQEDYDSARVLAREINRLLPGDPAALRLLKETETPVLSE